MSDIYGKLNRVAKFAKRNALGRSSGWCAKYVRRAFQSEFGPHGRGFDQTGLAHEYHNNGVLKKNGFVEIDVDTPIQNGDVYVINKWSGSRAGHIALWSYTNWISDFVQNSSNIYGGRAVEFVLYRHKDALNGAKPSNKGWVKRKFLQPGVKLVATGDVSPMLTQRITRTITLKKEPNKVQPRSKFTKEGAVTFSKKNIEIARRHVSRNMGSTNLRIFLKNPNQSGLSRKQLLKVRTEVNYMADLFSKKERARQLTASKNMQPIDTWVDEVFKEVQKNGSVWLKKVLPSKAEIEKIIKHEVPVKGGLIDVTTVNSYNFAGPFQMGWAAWHEGPMSTGGISIPRGDTGQRKLAKATKQNAKGSAADLSVVAPGVVQYWNKQLRYFRSTMNSRGLGYKMDSLPGTWEVLYAIHNQGPTGFAYFLENGRMLGGTESVAATSLLGRLRKRIM